MCDEQEDVDAPRVGCGCRICYKTRELSVDPRLLMMAHGVRSNILYPEKNIPPIAQHIIYKHIVGYLYGRMDYGALNVSIIQGLTDAMNQQQNQIFDVMRKMPSTGITAKES